jgi:phosphatidate cytidylyltransferase
MSSFSQRSLSGLIYVVLFIGSVLYSKESFVTLTAIFGLICIREFSRLIQFRPYLAYLVFIALIVLFAVREESFDGVLYILIIALTGSIQVLTYLFSKKIRVPKRKLLKEDLTIRYIVLSFGFLMFLPFSGGSYEPEIIIYLLLLIWSNDSFAYLIGKNFGKRKLFVSVSPNKTIEGFLGGVFFTMITAVVISFYSDLFSLIEWVLLGVLVSVFGTLGDLIESKFKRQANIKDSGNIMPGHGGMLDRLDSLLFVAPFVYLYIYFII